MMKRNWPAIVLTLCVCLTTARADDVRRGNHWDALLRDGAPVYDDPEVTARVAEIGQKVVAASGNPLNFEFRFTVLNSAESTAFAAPGGFVYVTTGLLQNLKSEDELAAVLAHEIGHINERHPMRTGMSPGAKKFWTTVISLGSMAAGAYLSSVVGEALRGMDQTIITPNGYMIAIDPVSSKAASLVDSLTQIATSQLGQQIVVSFYQGYKDEFEFKADELAMTYSKSAGYKPDALLGVFERLINHDGEPNPLAVSHLHSPKGVLKKRIAQANQQLKARAAQ
jgi:predicted Zn-dependent protease